MYTKLCFLTAGCVALYLLATGCSVQQTEQLAPSSLPTEVSTAEQIPTTAPSSEPSPMRIPIPTSSPAPLPASTPISVPAPAQTPTPMPVSSAAVERTAIPAAVNLPWGELTDSLYRFPESGGDIPEGSALAYRLVWGEQSIPSFTMSETHSYGLNALHKPQTPQALPQNLLYQEISITTQSGKVIYQLYENGMIYTIQQDKLYFLGQDKLVTDVNLEKVVNQLLFVDYPDTPLTRDPFETQVFTDAQPTRTVTPPTYAETGPYQVALQLRNFNDARQTVQILSGEDKQTILGALNDSQEPLPERTPPSTGMPPFILVRRDGQQWNYGYFADSYVFGYSAEGSFPRAHASREYTIDVYLLIAKALFSYTQIIGDAPRNTAGDTAGNSLAALQDKYYSAFVKNNSVDMRTDIANTRILQGDVLDTKIMVQAYRLNQSLLTWQGIQIFLGAVKQNKRIEDMLVAEDLYFAKTDSF